MTTIIVLLETLTVEVRIAIVLTAAVIHLAVEVPMVAAHQVIGNHKY
jgi:hypothetical protein